MARTPEQAEQGIQFPLIDGRRSTQASGRRIFAEAVRYVDAELADRIESAQNWRKTYLPAVRQTIELGVRSSKDALRIAGDGLEAAQSHFVVADDGETKSIQEAFGSQREPRFQTEIIDGSGEREKELTIPSRGEPLRGDSLRRRVDEWRSEGRIEPSAAAAVAAVVDNPQWLDLRDSRFALLGAASEMGPLEWLTRWGAEILAVDLPVEDLWERIVGFGKQGAGRLHVPVARTGGDITARAGADLLSAAPEIRTWLAESAAQFMLGNYAYADGALFARVAVAADALAADLASSGHLKGYAYLASPTEVYSVPPEVVEASRGGGVAGRVVRGISRGRLFAPTYDSVVDTEVGPRGIFDCLVPQQGPNYALAKALQRWRAVSMRDAGVVTSANVAPATRTKSVVKNKVLAAAYAGARPFGVEVFEPATSRALMAALLVHDIRNPQAAAHPSTSLEHPYDLFVEGAAHGGLWRMTYAPRSALPLAVILGFPRTALRR